MPQITEVVKHFIYCTVGRTIKMIITDNIDVN